jgi:AhpD family alkylhydroperoxidase
MVKDYSKSFNDLTKLMSELGAKLPETIKGFKTLHSASISKGVLSAKTKELIALGIAISEGCDGCIVLHIYEALKSGATSEEIAETISVAILMGGEPAVVYGSEALKALEQFIVLEKNGTRTT